MTFARNLGKSRKECREFAGAQVPMLDFDVKPDLSWLVGADVNLEDGGAHVITQAAQQFKMRMDETGTRVKVATVVVASPCIREDPVVFVLNKPF
jgi:hypothetical protein